MSDDANKDDNLQDPSTEDNQTEDPNVSEDDNTQDPEEEADDGEVEETDEKPAPFHEHPRFKEVIKDNQSLKAELEQLRKDREEEQNIATMSKEDKAMYSIKKKYGLATQDDIAAIRQQNTALQEELKFEKFLQKVPAASEKVEAIKALSNTPTYKHKSYESIYKEVFGSSDPNRKVVKRKVRTGMKTTSSGAPVGGGATKVFTRKQIDNMDSATFRKNEAKIEQQMSKGLIK